MHAGIIYEIVTKLDLERDFVISFTVACIGNQVLIDLNTNKCLLTLRQY